MNLPASISQFILLVDWVHYDIVLAYFGTGPCPIKILSLWAKGPQKKVSLEFDKSRNGIQICWVWHSNVGEVEVDAPYYFNLLLLEVRDTW